MKSLRKSYYVLIIFGVIWFYGFMNYAYITNMGISELIIGILFQFGFFGVICVIFLLSVKMYNKRKLKKEYYK